MTADSAGRRAKATGRRASSSNALQALARTGLAARGLNYLLVGYLAVRVAFGQGGKEADRQGALQTLASKPGGVVVLWLVALGFAGLALWRLAEALYGQAGTPDGDKPGKRLYSLVRGVFYVVVCASTVAFVIGAGGSGSSDKKSKDFTGKAMHDVPLGRWLVLLAGLAFIGAGIGIAVRAFQKKFAKRLKTEQMGPRTRKIVLNLGMVGRSTRATVFVAIGVFIAYAGITYDPKKAQGIDGALRKFADTPAGPWLLVLVALGLATFGVYSFCEARWRKVDPASS